MDRDRLDRRRAQLHAEAQLPVAAAVTGLDSPSVVDAQSGLAALEDRARRDGVLDPSVDRNEIRVGGIQSSQLHQERVVDDVGVGIGLDGEGLAEHLEGQV